MTMTKKEAIEKTIFIWKKIAMLPDDMLLGRSDNSIKADIYDQYDLKKDLHYCPCCEYDNKVRTSSKYMICSQCPIWSDEFPCIRDFNTYYGFSAGDDIDKKRECAVALVRLAESKLAELEAEEKSNDNIRTVTSETHTKETNSSSNSEETRN